MNKTAFLAATCVCLAMVSSSSAAWSADLWFLRAPVADRTGDTVGPMWGDDAYIYERINNSGLRNQVFTDALASTTDGGIETPAGSGESYFDIGDGFAEWVLNVHNPTDTDNVTVDVYLYAPDGTQVNGSTTYNVVSGSASELINESHAYWTTSGTPTDPRFSFALDSQETISLWTGSIFTAGTPDETKGTDGEWFRPTVRVKSTADIQAHIQGYHKHRGKERAGTTESSLSDKVLIDRLSYAGSSSETSVGGTSDMRLTLPWFRELNRIQWTSNTSAPSYNSVISVTNTTNNANDIWIYVYNKDGSQTSISPSYYNKELAAHETFTFSPSQFFTNGAATNPKLEGFVKIIGDSNIVAISQDFQMEQQPAIYGQLQYWWESMHITPLLEEVIAEP